MNVVVYSTNLEPITILELPLWLLEQLETKGSVRIAIRTSDESTNPDTVALYCEKLRWRDGTTKVIIVTPDEELALTLKPEWLPGQQATVQSYRTYIRHLTDKLIRAMRKD
jgi:hypothetical protein